MVRAAVKLLLLSWAVTVRMEDEFEESEDARSVPPKKEILQFPQPEISPPNDENEFDEIFRQPKENRIASEAAANLFRSAQGQQLKEDTAILFEAMEACRGSHPSMSNQTFNLQLYGSLLGELVGVESEMSRAALRHCNISEEVVGKLKAKLSKLEPFQDVFVLIPRNNSSESPEHGKSTQQPNSPPSRIHSQRSVPTAAVESNLKLKLGDEWIQVEPKVSHLSHIYLGSSIYPLLTEESRVLDKDHTIPSPTSTEVSPIKETHMSSGRMSGFVSVLQRTLGRKMYPSESPPQQQENKLKTLLRPPRSLRKNTPKFPESNLPEETADSHLWSTDAPQRLNLLPSNPYRWDTGEDDGDKKVTKCPLDSKEFDEDPRYRVVYKLCSAVLEHFRKFLKAEVLKQRMKSQD